MTKEEKIKEVFERHVFRMANKPHGLDMEAMQDAMEEYAKQEIESFSKWLATNSLDFQSTASGEWIGLDMVRYSHKMLYTIYQESKAQ